MSVCKKKKCIATQTCYTPDSFIKHNSYLLHNTFMESYRVSHIIPLDVSHNLNQKDSRNITYNITYSGFYDPENFKEPFFFNPQTFCHEQRHDATVIIILIHVLFKIFQLNKLEWIRIKYMNFWSILEGIIFNEPLDVALCYIIVRESRDTDSVQGGTFKLHHKP